MACAPQGANSLSADAAPARSPPHRSDPFSCLGTTTAPATGSGGGSGGPVPGAHRRRQRAASRRAAAGGPGAAARGGGPTPPDIEELIARLRASCAACCRPGSAARARPARSRRPGGFSGGRGLAMLAGRWWSASGWSSGFYRVEPDEQGVVLRFGAYNRTTPPGLNWHFPWPIESVLLPAVTRINRIEIGYRSAPTRPRPGQRRGAIADVPAESLMLTGDENIIDIDFAVFWRIRDAGAFPVQHPQPGLHGEVGGRERDARGDRPHPDPAGADRRARARSRKAVKTGVQAILDALRLGRRDHPGAVAEGRSAGRGHREFPRRAARQHRRRTHAQRGRELPQRHRAARPRRRRRHRRRGGRRPPGLGGRRPPARRSASCRC